MAVKLRMSRGGRKKQPFYHIVAADERMPRDGRYIEKLGYYNPNVDGGLLKWDAEAVNAWLNKGAQPTTTVAKMILKEGLGTDTQRARMEAPIARRRKIIETRLAAEKATKDAEAKAAAEAAAAEAAAAEAPAEEAAAE